MCGDAKTHPLENQEVPAVFLVHGRQELSSKPGFPMCCSFQMELASFESLLLPPHEWYVQAVYCLLSSEEQGHAHQVKKIWRRNPSCLGPRLRGWATRAPGAGAAFLGLRLSWSPWSARCCCVSRAQAQSCPTSPLPGLRRDRPATPSRVGCIPPTHREALATCPRQMAQDPRGRHCRGCGAKGTPEM